MKVYPKITVITVVYNARDDLRRTFESVFSQTYPNLEYIVIDGGSTDGTVELIQEYQDKIAYSVSERDSGIYDAMNKGGVASTGDYINFLNAGDYYCSPTTLSEVSEHMFENVDIVYGWHRVTYGNGKVKEVRSEIIPGVFPRFMPVSHQSLFIRSLYVKKHKFDMQFHLAADFFQFCNCVKDGATVRNSMVFVSDVLAGGVSDLRRCEVWGQYMQVYSFFLPLRLQDKIYYTYRIWLEPLKATAKYTLRMLRFYR